MKKIVLFATAVLFLFAGTAMADSIAGKFGVTARGGASYIFNSEFTDVAIADMGVNKDIKPDIGWAAGGGIMYGITDNLAVDFDVIYSQANVKASDATHDAKLGTGKTVDFALGVQWRFIPKSRFVPYVGAGVDVFWNQFTADEELFGSDTKIDVDVTYGGHVSAGADFFFTPNIALNAEIRGVYSTKGDMKIHDDPTGTAVAKYNPSNISGFIGIRFFFP